LRSTLILRPLRVRGTFKNAPSNTKTGVRPKEAFVDRGYRGKERHPEDVKVHITDQRKARGALKKRFKRRNAIEPVIGHEKQEQRTGRNHLKGHSQSLFSSRWQGWQPFKDRFVAV
jgi:hypothetical protein